MAKAGTIREARSNVVTIARQIAEQSASGQISDDTLTALKSGLTLLDERTAASNASRKKAE